MQEKRKAQASAFERLTRALVAVPKEEIDEKAREYERKKTKRRKKKGRKRRAI